MNQSLDKSFLAIILSLGAISLSVIFASERGLALNQLIFWIIGLIAFIASANVFYPEIERLTKPLYLISIVSLIVVLIVADPVRGSTRWIDFGIFRIQPAEIAKLSAILSLSAFFVKNQSSKLKNILLSFLLILPLFFLILIEPDIGSSGAIVAVWLGMIFASGIKKRQIFTLLAVAVISFVIAFNFLAQYQKERIETFINPARDPLGTGYNIIQSKIAVGSGQFFGRGLGKGTQSQLNFLPESESDFIFASTAEQLGFFGSTLLITLFIFLVLKVLNVAKKADRLGQLIVSGTVSLLLYQFFVNTGMNMGILPVTGITLPLVSYGGSSLITTLILLGLVVSVKKQEESF